MTPSFVIEPLAGEGDLDGVLAVEQSSFANPWTREMYAWELQNPSVCHIYVLRTPDCPVAGFAAFWLVFDEVHINNIALRPEYRGQGLGTSLMRHVLAEVADRCRDLVVVAGREAERRSELAPAAPLTAVVPTLPADVHDLPALLAIGRHLLGGGSR